MLFFTHIKLVVSVLGCARVIACIKWIRLLVSSVLSNRWLQVVLYGKPTQEHPVNAGVPQGCGLGPTLFLL